MVIASNEWMNYDDDQKQSQMIETNVLMMAAPSPVLRSAVSTAAADGVVAPNAAINTITVGNNGTSSIINSDSAECEAIDTLARIVLICQPDSHPFQTRTILLAPNIECKVGRSIAKSKASDSNAIFDCKVLSRNHAVLWYSSDGKFYVKDTKSSNGTFINERKIPASEPVELNFGDVVKFGVEVMENSRKEVHGCIIASVKPYLPDGREAISISQLSQSSFRGDSRISFEELHRLNLYMQETSQREKLLKAKLQNIQNILDATRKNSTICWQSMIDEDRLLNRIDLLENKLQFLQKNSPADQLKEEIIKLQDEKFVYQNSAKEALRKVYQERMDAMQMLSKMERDFTSSENECSLLRDQIRYTKQNLQDVNSRLLRLETEYSEYKDQMEKCQRETNEEQSNFDATAADLADKLKERETECEEYKKKIGELLITRAEQLDLSEESRKEKYTDECVVDAISTANSVDTNITNSSSTTTTLADGIEPEDNNDGLDCEINNHDGNTTNLAAKKSTIMKWLENSDLNQKEGSFDIMKAICNESDSDESDTNDIEEKCTIDTTSSSISSSKYSNKLELVAKNLAQLEIELANGNVNTTGIENGNQDHEHGSQPLLQYSVELLREALIEISKQEKPLPAIQSSPTQLQPQDTLIVNDDKYEEEVIRQAQAIDEYQNEIRKLQLQLEDKESKTAYTMDTLQTECASLKDKISDLTKVVDCLRDEKDGLEKVIAENKSNTAKSVIETEDQNSSPSTSSTEDSFDKLIEEDTVAMNNAAVIQEEELILYKDRFGKTQAENLKLKREIAELKLKSDDFYNEILKKSLTYGVVFVALIVYFIFSYF